MYRFLARPRWIGFALLVVLTILACLALARWQWDRLDEREARNAVVSQHTDTPVVAAAELLPVEGPLPAADEWRRVSITGTYDDTSTRLVRKRYHQGRPGLNVLTALRAPDGPGLWVNRGWVPAAASATAEVDRPDPPAGQVTVVVRMRQAEPGTGKVADDLPEGQVSRIDTTTLDTDVGFATFAGYGELISEDPAPDEAPEPVAAPDLGDGPHLSYAIQWITFACVAIVGWYVLIRKEADRLRAERATTVGAAAP